MAKRLIVFLMMVFGVALLAPLAEADTGNIIEKQNTPATSQDGWQSANCTSDSPIQCSPETPNLYFKTAAGHPPIGFTQYIVKHKPFEELAPGVIVAPIEEPQNGRTIKTLRVDLPPGLTVNPQATPEKCTLANFEREIEVKPGEKLHVPNCEAATILGREEVTLVTNVPGVEVEPKFKAPEGFVIPPSEASGTKVPVYNLVPNPGEPALEGFVIAGQHVVFLKTEVSWESDYHESFTISLPPLEPGFSTLISRQVSIGTTGNGAYITNPNTCFNPEEAAFKNTYSTFFQSSVLRTRRPEFPRRLDRV